MGDILVIGSVAIDSVESPYGKQEECFGGSASYFSYAASFFSPVKLVAVVGEDFPAAFKAILEEKNVDLTGLEVTEGKTFRWKGRYTGDMNSAETLDTQLNVFEKFSPTVPDSECDFLFLANIDPRLQLDVVKKIKPRRLVASDTMNLWINIKRDELVEVLGNVDLFVLNDAEAKLLTGEENLVKAIKKIAGFGPTKVVIKKGEHGSLGYFEGTIATFPAYPLEEVYDPTGAGDSFAGGMLGYLAQQNEITYEQFVQAIVHGTIVASFTVERFSLERLREISVADIEGRLAEFKALTHF